MWGKKEYEIYTLTDVLLSPNTDSNDIFLTISIDIKGKLNLIESLEEYFETEIIDGYMNEDNPNGITIK